MTDSEIRAVFNRVYNGKANFMTPNAWEFGKRGKMVWELSTGTGFRDQRLFGVTVIELPNTKRHDLSQCFDSAEAAKAYIKGDFTNA